MDAADRKEVHEAFDGQQVWFREDQVSKNNHVDSVLDLSFVARTVRWKLTGQIQGLDPEDFQIDGQIGWPGGTKSE